MQSRWMTRAAVAAMSAVIVMGYGCADLDSSAEEDPMAKRFDRNQKGPDTSNTALELTARYTQLAEKAAALHQQNQALSEENGRLQKQTDTLESQLKQTQKELTEANALLVDILGELNKWKSDILGFRNEMRLTAKTQLEALLKILEVLGAEAGPLQTSVEPNSPEPNAPISLEPSR